MSYTTETVVHPEYLEIRVSVDYLSDDLFQFLDHVRAEVTRTDLDRVLVDSSDFRGSMSESEKFFAGQHIAEVFGATIKLALIMPAVEVTKLGQIAATNRGAKFYVTASRVDALAWLLDPAA